jgi:hypothetical protein
MMMNVEIGSYYALRDVAARIWDLIETPRTEAEICTTLQREFEVDWKTCSQAVTAFLAELVENGLANREGQPASG